MEKNYQTSFTNSQGQMFVARADTFEDFKKICEDMGIAYSINTEPTRYDNRQGDPSPRKVLETNAQSNQYCQMHNKDLKRRETPFGILYDHRRQINGVWNKCTGTGWKADKPREEYTSGN